MSQAADRIRQDQSPWIKIGDFTEISYVVRVVNNTTQTEVPQSKAVEVTEFSDGGVLLRLPQRSCAQGHLLTLHLERRRLKPFTPARPKPEMKKDRRTRLWVIEDQIQLTAKVLEVEPLKGGQASVTLQFYQCDQAHWDLFLKDLIARQKDLSKVVRSITG